MAFRTAPANRVALPRKRKAQPDKPTKRPTGPDNETVTIVLRRGLRDGRLCCEVCGEPLHGYRSLDWSVHHRRGRDGQRTDNSPSNLLLVCGADNMTGCHGRIHQRRSESQPAGWWLSRITGEDPRMTPVLVDAGSRWVYLSASGDYLDNPEVA